jgi:purine-nucleoside phosphorylase
MSFHLEAKPGQIAQSVLLPGDPLRAKFVADTFLEKPECYNNVRGMLGFTGLYKGKKVSVQGTGMGMPSHGIYVHELINDYGVKNLIRIGSCGAIQKKLPLGKVILANAASGDSSANNSLFKGLDFAAVPDFQLLLAAYQKAKELKIDVITSPIFSTDTFYDLEENRWDVWRNHGIIAVEMESQMLYTMAARFGVKALSILTVSDNIVTGESCSSDDRERSFTDMMKIALEVAVR